MLLLEALQVTLRRPQLNVNLACSLLEETGQLLRVLLPLRLRLLLVLLVGATARLLEGLLGVLELFLILLDDLVAEVTSLGELLLDLLVQLQILLQRLDLRGHRPILVYQILGLLRLKLQLTRQLLVLLDR